MLLIDLKYSVMTLGVGCQKVESERIWAKEGVVVEAAALIVRDGSKSELEKASITIDIEISAHFNRWSALNSAK